MTWGAPGSQFAYGFFHVLAFLSGYPNNLLVSVTKGLPGEKYLAHKHKTITPQRALQAGSKLTHTLIV